MLQTVTGMFEAIKHRIHIVAFCFLVLYLLFATPAAIASDDILNSEAVVSPALLEVLKTEDRAGAKIFFLASSGPDPLSQQSEINQEVDPVVVEIAQALLPGELSLVDLEWVRALRGVVSAEVVERLRGNPRVLSIELDRSVPIVDPGELSLTAAATGSCVPTSTKACVQGGRFGISVGTTFLPGNFAPVAVSGSQSAVFYFYNSNNWEVLVKVLNGCAINNRYWVFAAGATSSSYAVNIHDTARGIIGGYGLSCPLADTSTWTC